MGMELVNTFTLAIHWACMIENGDYSGHDARESAVLNNWLDALPVGHKTFDWKFYTVPDGEEISPIFARDDISGLMDDCVEVDVYLHDGYTGLEKRLTHKYISEFDRLDEWQTIGQHKQLCREVLSRGESYDDSTLEVVMVHVKPNKGTLVNDVKKAIDALYHQHGCTHEHDCCGCWSTGVSDIRHLGSGIYTAFLSSSRNF